MEILKQLLPDSTHLQLDNWHLDATETQITLIVSSKQIVVPFKFCPRCWIPGNAPDPIWTELRSKYCFACGTVLLSRCPQCQEPIVSLKFRFCPYCGTAYKSPSTLKCQRCPLIF